MESTVKHLSWIPPWVDAVDEDGKPPAGQCFIEALVVDEQGDDIGLLDFCRGKRSQQERVTQCEDGFHVICGVSVYVIRLRVAQFGFAVSPEVVGTGCSDSQSSWGQFCRMVSWRGPGVLRPLLTYSPARAVNSLVTSGYFSIRLVVSSGSVRML